MISAHNIQSEYIANFNFFVKLFTVYEETDFCLISTYSKSNGCSWQLNIVT
jgi:hypothetical protein